MLQPNAHSARRVASQRWGGREVLCCEPSALPAFLSAGWWKPIEGWEVALYLFVFNNRWKAKTCLTSPQPTPCALASPVTRWKFRGSPERRPWTTRARGWCCEWLGGANRDLETGAYNLCLLSLSTVEQGGNPDAGGKLGGLDSSGVGEYWQEEEGQAYSPKLYADMVQNGGELCFLEHIIQKWPQTWGSWNSLSETVEYTMEYYILWNLVMEGA